MNKLLTTDSGEPFQPILGLIGDARVQVERSINNTLLDLYLGIGREIDQQIKAAGWGRGTIEQLSAAIRAKYPSVRGFSAQNLWRMRQFHEAASHHKLLPELARALGWSHLLLVLGRCDTIEEREFYLLHAREERWTVRELERQLDSALYLRTRATPPILSTPLREIHPQAGEVFKDAYVLDFLQLGKDHGESDLHQALLVNLRQFLIELGRDFCFIGSEFPLQVGTKDFSLDLLFYHRDLQCLVAIELKIDDFKPEYLGKLEFYLEALDRQVRKPHEKASIGVLLCAGKDAEVVEYALSRTLSPALVAEYKTRLVQPELLLRKLQELHAQALKPAS